MSIESLFEALRRGDERTLEKLLPPLRVRLVRLAKQRLGEQEVEEVVQETLRTLWEKRDSLREPGHLLPFVFQTLRHKIGSTYLRAQRGQRTRLDEGGLQELPAEPASVHPEALLLAAELEEIVVKAIRTCAAENPGFGEVLQLLREGRSPSEIQKQLGDLTMGAVRTRICRARKRLREILKEEFHFDL